MLNDERKTLDVGPRSLRGWRFSGKPGAVRHWRRDRRSASGTIRIARWIGRQDNNVAEYVALLEALQCAQKLKARALHVYSDSQVVVRQMQGEYACRSPRLYSLHWICRKLARSFKFSITHVPRERNAEANIWPRPRSANRFPRNCHHPTHVGAGALTRLAGRSPAGF